MPASANVDIEGIAELKENLGELPDKVREELAEKLFKAAFKGDKVAKRRLKQKQSGNQSGKLRQTIGVRKRPTPKDLEAIVSAGGRETSEDGFDYALAVEFGTRPHFPPVEAVTGKEEALDRWVGRGSVSTKENETQDEAQERIAFLIARRISQVGTREKPFMRPAFTIARAKLRKELREIDLDL